MMDSLEIRRYSQILVSPMSSQGFLYVKNEADGSRDGKDVTLCGPYADNLWDWKRTKEKMLPERFHKKLRAADASGATK